MALSDEINSCEPIPGAPTGPRQVPRDQIFCDNVTVQKNLEVTGESQLSSLSIGTAEITVGGLKFKPTVINTVSGPHLVLAVY